MIYRIRGLVQEKILGEKDLEPALVVVEVGGLGFGLLVSAVTLGALPAVGREARLWTHLEVREDEWVLVGFSSPEEKAMYRMLRGISGIGPRLALSLLGLGREALQEAARTGSLHRLETVPGVGRKTAQRVLLELQQKTFPWEGEGARGPAAGEGPLEDAVAALTSLGYTPSEAWKALQEVRKGGDEGRSPEEWVRDALRVLAGT
ncbi:MAG: Holliday junction branch migration protein RuvA [Bacillota bacterium]|nr:Holliday junction branch migration protein RuvA [Bacillota bacterium]